MKRDAISGGWYLIRIKSGWDRKVEEFLRYAGLISYLPAISLPKSDGTIHMKPLFPGYAFIYMESDGPDWAKILDLPGILSWLSFDGVIPSIPETVIESIREKVKDLSGKAEFWSRLKRGELVQVVTGKIEVIAEVFEDAKSPDSPVILLMEFMGRMVRASVPWHMIAGVYDETKAPRNVRRRRRTRGRGRLVRY